MTLKAAYHHVAVALRKARSVVVCAHVRPDGDAVGSVLALTLALREAGIPAIPTLADAGVTAPSTYAFLPGYSLYAQAADLEAPDVFVALDTPIPDRIGEGLAVAETATTVCVLDHHPDATEWGDINVLDPACAATGQMVWHLLEALDAEPSADVALCCYVALLTDTGRFQYDNTTADVLRDAASMLEAGVSPSEASRLVYQSRTAGALALEARAMSRLTVVNGGRVAYSWIDGDDFAETGAHQSEAEMLPDAIRALGGVDVVAFMREKPGEIRVGLRAKTGFDVSAVAREFGGGGHRAAAGLTW
ncbi:MAG: bifunctional oligoribonuclease/PAP phosphatase NrnA, partial [Actinobacteria bacterium]